METWSKHLLFVKLTNHLEITVLFRRLSSKARLDHWESLANLR